MAFGWLPNKSELIYRLFLILVMEAFQAQIDKTFKLFGKKKLKMKKVKMDFELNIHNAFGGLFKIKGCFFFTSGGFIYI